MHAESFQSFDELVKVNTSRAICVKGFESELRCASRVRIRRRLLIDGFAQLLLEQVHIRAWRELKGGNLRAIWHFLLQVRPRGGHHGAKVVVAVDRYGYFLVMPHPLVEGHFTVTVTFSTSNEF